MSDEIKKKLDKLETKQDVILEKIGSIDTTLAKHHVVLKEHIRRTELLEQDIKPIKTHVAMVSGALKFIGLLSIFATIGLTIIEVLKYTKG